MDVDGTSWGGLTHVSGLDPFPRSTELLSSVTAGSSIGKYSKAMIGTLTVP